MSNKALGICLFCSMAAHLFFGVYVGGGLAPSERALSDRDVITPLEYVAPPKMTAPAQTMKAKPAPVYKPTPVNPAAVIQKPVKITRSNEKKVESPVRATDAPASAVKSSSELLMDPKKGKIFSRYFLRIKQKIYQTVHDRYMARTVGKGSVSLVFLMGRNGNLEEVTVLDRETRAGAQAREFAIQCVKDSSPFDAFPKELATDKICFNVTLVFDES